VVIKIYFIVSEHSKKREKLNESFYLWKACQSLFSAIDTYQNDSKHELIPLQDLVNNIKNSGGGMYEYFETK
jgi:hypothetical protein